MKRFLPFSLFRLHNMELANFCISVIQITQKNNPDALKLTEAFTILKNGETYIYKLSSQNNNVPKSVPYKGTRLERKNCVLALKKLAYGIYLINTPEKREYIQLLYPIIKTYFTNYYRKNIVEQNEIVSHFLHRIDSTPTLAYAVKALGMQSEIEQLRYIHNTFIDKYNATRKIKAEYVKSNSAKIKRDLCILLEDFFVNLYVAKKQNKEVDYTELQNELNTEIQRVKQILTERKPTKKKTAITDTETI